MHYTGRINVIFLRAWLIRNSPFIELSQRVPIVNLLSSALSFRFFIFMPARISMPAFSIPSDDGFSDPAVTDTLIAFKIGRVALNNSDLDVALLRTEQLSAS